MSRIHAYPADLARYVAANWPGPGGLQLPESLLQDALSEAYQASLTSEEGRPVRFRLLLTAAERLPEGGAPNEGVLRLLFQPSRRLHADELRRLSPSTPFETSLIGAHVEEGKLRIWGIAHSGPAWLAPSWGGRDVVPTWTFDPIIHVTGPGQLAVRCAGTLVAALERGQVVDAMIDVFDSTWLPTLFADEREMVRAEHAASQAGAPSPTLVEHSLIGRVNQHMLRRAIQLIRGARHGGMILCADLPPSSSGTAPGAATPEASAPGTVLRAEVLDGLRLKYRFAPDEPARRYRSLLLQILDALARRSVKSSIDWQDFVKDGSPILDKLEQSVFELSRLYANLTAIDGAVVLDKRLSLLGFGAEVSAELPTPERVFRALDREGEHLQLDDIENVGTRHRAAYRFVKAHPRGLALVVSHDGGVVFVANRDGEVVFWEQSVSP